MSVNAANWQTPELVPCALCGRPVQHQRGELRLVAGNLRTTCAPNDISGCLR